MGRGVEIAIGPIVASRNIPPRRFPDNGAMHLLIPFASSDAPACAQALQPLRLPHLEKLLGRLTLVDTDAGSPTSFSPPHERALARHYGMAAPDGAIAWAAREAALSGRSPHDSAWAWITPVHWEVGSDHITMGDPRTLNLQEAESRALLAAMAPYFAQDGIALDYAAPTRWLASGAIFTSLPSASLDRVIGREISAWMPSAPSLRRLQNEMQKLLYTHCVNDQRSALGQATVNSFWVSASGVLPPAGDPHRVARLDLADSLRDAALANDWAAWALAWMQLDLGSCKALLALLDAGQNGRLTLCGNRGALVFESTRRGWLERLHQRLRPPTTLHALRGQL